MKLSSANLAGLSLFVGTVQFAFFMMIAEALYPNYNVSTNYISDLGATCSRTACQVFEPSATIFNSSIILLGLLVLANAYFIRRAFSAILATVVIAVAGIGAIGVGVFPETAGVLHSVFSLITFLFAGLSAIFVSRYSTTPMKLFSIVAGVITLVALALYVSRVYLGLGNGGMERVVVFPVLLWGIGFGGHLMGRESTPG